MTSVAVRSQATGGKSVQGVATSSISLRQLVNASPQILAIGYSSIRIALRSTVVGGSGSVNAQGVSLQRIAIRPAGGLRSVAGVSAQQLPLRSFVNATKRISGIASSSLSIWPVEIGQKGVAATPRSTLALVVHALGSGALSAFGHARSVLSLRSFGAMQKDVSAAPRSSLGLGSAIAGSKSSVADSRSQIMIRSFISGTAIATVFGVSRISLSLSSLIGGEKSIAGAALSSLGIQLQHAAEKMVAADTLTSVAVRQVMTGISGSPARVVREIRGARGLFDIDYGKRGSAQKV